MVGGPCPEVIKTVKVHTQSKLQSLFYSPGRPKSGPHPKTSVVIKSCLCRLNCHTNTILPSVVLESPGAVGPTFLSGSLGPISVFTLERVPGELSLDSPAPPPPQRRVDTCEAVARHSHRRTDPGSEFLPPCPNKSRAATGSPWGPRTPSRTAPPLADRP